MPMSLSHELQRGAPSDEQAASTDRGWFLLDCAWNDAVWTLRPTNLLEEPRPVRLLWGFSMPNGRVFTDDRYASLLESSRQLIAIIRRRGLSTGLAQRARTVNGYFMYLRELLRWMDRAGISRFGSLDATAVRQFQRAIAERAGVAGDRLANSTVGKYLYLFTYLYRFRDEIDDGLTFDPFPGRSHGDVAGVRDADIRRWPHTPDAVAVALVKQAIDLVSVGAGNILQARQVYADAMASAERRGCGIAGCNKAARRALQQAALKVPGHDRSLTTVRDMARAIDMLYAACFVVIAYLVGARASEILSPAGRLRTTSRGRARFHDRYRRRHFQEAARVPRPPSSVGRPATGGSSHRGARSTVRRTSPANRSRRSVAAPLPCQRRHRVAADLRGRD